MIRWREAARGRDSLRIHRIEAESGAFSGPGGRMPSPLAVVLDRFNTQTSRYLQDRFGEGGTPVGASSLSVACHVVSLPELTVVVDSTYRTTAPGIFPVPNRAEDPCYGLPAGRMMLPWVRN